MKDLDLESIRRDNLHMLARLKLFHTKSALCLCTHKNRHHFKGSRRTCKYRGCGCRRFRLRVILPEDAA